MPNMIVLVSGVQVNNGIKVQFEATVATVPPVKISDVFDADFGLSAIQMNKAVEDAAKATMLANGVTIGVLDKVITFGGQVS